MVADRGRAVKGRTEHESPGPVLPIGDRAPTWYGPRSDGLRNPSDKARLLEALKTETFLKP